MWLEGIVMLSKVLVDGEGAKVDVRWSGKGDALSSTAQPVSVRAASNVWCTTQTRFEMMALLGGRLDKLPR